MRREDRIGKLDCRIGEGILLGYSSKRKAYKCFNLRLNKIVESISVQIDDSPQNQDRSDK